MSRGILCAANWKLNKNPCETREFLVEFLERVDKEEQGYFAIFPPAINLLTLSECLKNTFVTWGAQNVYFEESGAFTGENSAQVVKSLGATMCLVGHSERRSLFSETDQDFAKKVRVVQKLEMTPMLCVGERLEDRQAGKTNEVIGNQLRASTAYVDWSHPLILAYEPVWAIGTGQVATPEQAEEAHQFLRSQVSELAGGEVSEKIQILYGGSTKPENSAQLFSQKNVDGFLIGGASLKPEIFVGIYKNAKALSGGSHEAFRLK